MNTFHYSTCSPTTGTGYCRQKGDYRYRGLNLDILNSIAPAPMAAVPRHPNPTLATSPPSFCLPRRLEPLLPLVVFPRLHRHHQLPLRLYRSLVAPAPLCAEAQAAEGPSTALRLSPLPPAPRKMNVSRLRITWYTTRVLPSLSHWPSALSTTPPLPTPPRGVGSGEWGVGRITPHYAVSRCIERRIGYNPSPPHPRKEGGRSGEWDRSR